MPVHIRFALMVFATSGSAGGLAHLIAMATHSFDQAAALGGGADMLLTALARSFMIPRPLMPLAMQTVTDWAPQCLALDGVQAISLGAADAALAAPKGLLSLVFVSVACCWAGVRRAD